MSTHDVWSIAKNDWLIDISAATGNIISLKHRSYQDCEFISPRAREARAMFGDFWLELQIDENGELRELFSKDFLENMTVFDRGVERHYLFRADADRRLCASEFLETGSQELEWKFEICNSSEAPIDIRSLRVFFPFNQDFGRLPQREMYQNRVIVRYLPAGHSGYQLVLRPNGDGPCLLVLPVGETGFWDITHENMSEYRKSNSYIGAASTYLLGGRILRGNFEASKGLKRRGPVSSLKRGLPTVLAPGEKISFSWKAAWVESVLAVDDNLVRSGKIAVRFFPGPSAPIDQEMRVGVIGAQTPCDVRCDGVRLDQLVTDGENMVWRIVADKVGQYRLRVTYGDGHQSEYLFFITPPAIDAIRNRAEFITVNQFLHDSDDPRNGAILQWDTETSEIVRTDPRPHVAGCSDECGLADAVFLAQKNVYWPNSSQIRELESYVHDFLRRRLQNAETFEVKRWVGDRAEWGQIPTEFMLPGWGQILGDGVDRTFNYVHVANIYYSFYRIGKMYGLTEKAVPEEYLKWAYRTIRTMYEQKDLHGLTAITTGHLGAGNFLNIRDSLLAEGFRDEYEDLAKLMASTSDFFCDADYPYGSEQSFDTSGYENIYFYTRDAIERTGKQTAARVNSQVVRILLATKGDQPCWFWFGSDLRWWDFVVTGKWLSFDETCHHYMSGLNGWALVDHYLRSGEARALRQGYGALLGILTNIEKSGAAHMAYHWGPEKTGFDPFSGEIGLGLYGYIQGASAIVVQDEVFGQVCYGGEVDDTGESLTITPLDGLGRRVYIPHEGIRLELDGAAISQVVLYRNDPRLLVDVEPVAPVAVNAVLRVGLPISLAVETIKDKRDDAALVRITRSPNGNGAVAEIRVTRSTGIELGLSGGGEAEGEQVRGRTKGSVIHWENPVPTGTAK